MSKQANQQTTTYSWDYENRMTRIDYPTESSNVFSTNADGQRMTANDSGGNRRFIYDGTSIVGEQDLGSGNLVVVYDHGNGGLARQVRGSTASYYQYDGLGSTRQMTDSNRAVTDTVSYDAWGNILSSSGTTTNGFKYVGSLGYYADSDSGLMLLGARYYGSGVGRFWSVDPIRDGHNWYAYGNNNPVNAADPTGLVPAWVVVVALVVVIGAMWYGGNVYHCCDAQAQIAWNYVPQAYNCGWPQSAADDVWCNDVFMHCVAACLIQANCGWRGRALCVSRLGQWVRGIRDRPGDEEQSAENWGRYCGNTVRPSVQNCAKCCQLKYSPTEKPN